MKGKSEWSAASAKVSQFESAETSQSGRHIWITLIIPYILIVFLVFLHTNEINNMSGSKILIIDKSSSTLLVRSYTGSLLGSFIIGLGENPGNKTSIGDLKTPEGMFSIVNIENSNSWIYDENDDTLPPVKGAYGPWFLRLAGPGFTGIGIHGTNDDSLLGQRCSHGCIRMNNQDLIKLRKLVSIGTMVIIIPSIEDQVINNQINSVPDFSH